MRDLRYAVRILIKSPAFAIISILTLALCIGANTAIYTVVDRILLRPLPYPEPERLAQVVTHFDRRGDDEMGQTGGTWEVLRDRLRSADLAVVAGVGMGVNLVAGGQPQNVQQQRVSAGFFRVLGVAPARGREFTPDEDREGGPALVILSHNLWIRLGADARLIGRAITLRGEPHAVVGVMPAGFTSGSPVDVWTPLRPSRRGEGGGQNYGIVARLRPGVTWPQADAEIAGAGQPAMDDLYRSPQNRAHLRVIPLQRAETADVRDPILILWSAVCIVLVIGCVNIAGLLMARGMSRAPEIATRIALGGGRATIVRQLLTESLVLAAMGGAAGLAIGYAGTKASTVLLRDAFGLANDVNLDMRVLIVTGLVALATSVVFGLIPALQASRVDLRSTLVDAGATTIAGAARSWPRRAMVGVEVALGVVLLVGAGLLLRTFDHLLRQHPGFDGTNVVSATVSLQDARYASKERVTQLFERTLARMRELSGVENAAAALTLPYERALNTGFRWIGDSQSQTINMTYVTPAYFDTLRVPVKRGRVFSEADSADAAPVVIVNEAFVRRYSSDRDPVGRQFAGNPPRTVVGVVADIQTKVAFGNFGPIGAAPAAYVPAAQVSSEFFTMVHTWFSPSWFLRASGPQSGIAAGIERALQSVDPLLPLAKLRTLQEVRGEAMATERAQTLLLTAFAVLALSLAAVGLYALVASAVEERRRELGIRLALGATAGQAVRVAAAPGFALAVVGVVVGLVAARLVARAMEHVVWGVSVGDSFTFAVAGALVFTVACVATLVPAMRIVRLNPIQTLRQS